MAVVRILAFLGLVASARAFSLVQLNAEVVALHAGYSPPSLDDVKETLGAVNDTIDKVTEIIDTINSTASEMLSTFMDSTADFVEVLGTLQKAADAAAMFSPEISDTASKFIDLANSTLDKATAKLPAMYAKIESELEANLAPIEKIALSLTSEFLSAAESVLALSNLTDSTSLLKKLKALKHVEKAAAKTNEKVTSKHNEKKHASKALAKTEHLKKTSIEKKQASKKHSKRKSKAMLLLEQRALRGEEVALNQVDQSVARKGSSSPCVKALAEITKANVTLFEMEAKIQAYNDTAYSLLGTYLDTATSAISMINASIAPAMDAASALPPNIMAPVTTALDKVLSVGDTLTSTVQDNLATIQDMITDAISTLEPVSSMADTLVEAVTQAQCAGACGEKEQTACQAADAVSS